MGRRIEVRVPSRIDLAGGWTDVPVYCQNKTGEVVNIAINQYVRSEMVIDDESEDSEWTFVDDMSQYTDDDIPNLRWTEIE